LGADALVIGAGPAGLLTAKEIVYHDFSVKILEEHTRVGVPNHCAGLLSIEGLKKLGIDPSPRFVQNEVFGGRIYAPDGRHIEIRDKHPRAFVVNRTEFDTVLAEHATDAGAEIIFNNRVKKLRISNGVAAGAEGDNWDEKSRIVIDAEGASRRLLKATDLGNFAESSLIGVNTEVECEVDSSMVEVWFGKDLAPGFFAWVIPISDKEARVGLASRNKDAAIMLDAFIKRRFGSTSHSTLRTGQVLVSGPYSRTTFPGLLLVGDSAGHVKPTTGGGVILGGLCALEAGRVASNALDSEDVSEPNLREYDRIWREKYGDEFRSMLTLRRFADGISDARMNRIFHSFSRAGLENILNRLVAEGDMDLQEGVIRRVFTEPRLTLALLSSLGRFAFDELRDLVNL
jgi:digeranylgeranylglycerophospholipid reductase